MQVKLVTGVQDTTVLLRLSLLVLINGPRISRGIGANHDVILPGLDLS